MRHIHLPAIDDKGEVVTREVLEVEDLGAGRLRLLHSPAFLYGLALGDVIRETPERRDGFQLLKRGGNLAIQVYFHGKVAKNGPDAARLTTQVEALGGRCEGGPGSMLVFSIPCSAGFSRVEALFDGFARGNPETHWDYSNVNDPATGAPLGWWND